MRNLAARLAAIDTLDTSGLQKDREMKRRIMESLLREAGSARKLHAAAAELLGGRSNPPVPVWIGQRVQWEIEDEGRKLGPGDIVLLSLKKTQEVLDRG